MNATSSTLKVRLATPQEVIGEFEGVSECYVPTSTGIVGVLPEHADLVSEVGTGVLHFLKGSQETYFVVSGGLLEVHNNQVMVLADVGEVGSSIDLKRAKDSLERARMRLTSLRGSADGDDVDVDRALVAERRALARIEAAESSQK